MECRGGVEEDGMHGRSYSHDFFLTATTSDFILSVPEAAKSHRSRNW